MFTGGTGFRPMAISCQRIGGSLNTGFPCANGGVLVPRFDSIKRMSEVTWVHSLYIYIYIYFLGVDANLLGNPRACLTGRRRIPAAWASPRSLSEVVRERPPEKSEKSFAFLASTRMPSPKAQVLPKTVVGRIHSSDWPRCSTCDEEIGWLFFLPK